MHAPARCLPCFNTHQAACRATSQTLHPRQLCIPFDWPASQVTSRTHAYDVRARAANGLFPRQAASGLVFTCPRCALHLGLAHSPSDFHRVMDDDSLSRVERLLRTLGAATATAAVATAAATAGGSGPATASSNPAPGPRPAPPIRLCAHPPFLYPIPESGLLYNKPYVTAHELVTLLSQLQPGSLRELGCKVQSGDRAVLVDGALCALLKGDYLRTTPRCVSVAGCCCGGFSVAGFGRLYGRCMLHDTWCMLHGCRQARGTLATDHAQRGCSSRSWCMAGGCSPVRDV